VLHLASFCHGKASGFAAISLVWLAAVDATGHGVGSIENSVGMHEGKACYQVLVSF
jgi:hypothetical protein